MNRTDWSAGQYYERCVVNGRAVIKFHPVPEENGEPRPKLWLCWLKETLVCCDDAGAHGDDTGYVEAVPETMCIAEVIERWKAYRNERLALMKAARYRGSMRAREIA